MLYLNYFLIALFAAMAVGWLVAGDYKQAVYFAGAFLCTTGVTPFK